MFGRKKKQVVGCDIGSWAIKVVELKPLKGGEYELVHAALAELPSEAIVEGSIMDASLVVETLNRLIADHGIKNPYFGTSVSGHSVIIKKIQLPTMTEEELAESIEWEAEHYIPFDINEVSISYVLLGEAAADTMDVLLVAVKKDKIADYKSVLVQAGKEPVLMDVDCFAVQNAYEFNYELSPEVIALVNVGAFTMNINILHEGQTVFWRDVMFGGAHYTEAIQKELNLTWQDAERLKRGEKVGDYNLQQLQPVLNTVSEELAAELQKTVDFFVATSAADRLDRVVLSGGSTRIPGLTDVLREKFQVPVEVMNPFRRIKVDESKFNPEWLNSNAPAMAVAVGMAIRTVGD